MQYLFKNIYLGDYQKSLPWFIIIITVLYLAIMFNLSYWVDIRFTNMFGLNDWLLATYDDYPILWVQMFREASPTEYLQWSYLGLSVLLSFGIFFTKLKSSSKIIWSWLLLTLGFILMFLEDVFNVRHVIGAFFAQYYLNLAWEDWIYNPIRSYTEMALYFVLASIMGIALILILKERKANLLGKIFMLSGYLCYGVAAFASASRLLGDYWYTAVGRAILIRIYPDTMIPFIKDSDIYGRMFMDYLVEESIELLGAAFLLAALTVFIISARKELSFYASSLYPG